MSPARAGTHIMKCHSNTGAGQSKVHLEKDCLHENPIVSASPAHTMIGHEEELAATECMGNLADVYSCVYMRLH